MKHYLPLAIHLAAGHLRAGRSVTGFLNRLRQQGLNLEHPDPADSNRRLSVAFELSLELLRKQLGADADRLLPAFYALGHGPIGGFGACLGAALAGLNAVDFEELAMQAHALSLLDRTPDGESWRLHPLLAELLRPRAEETTVLERMTDWFLERLPEGEAGHEADQGRRWGEIHRENAALVEWLARVPETNWVRVERAGSVFAIRSGPFDAWLDFCERALRNDLADDQKSNILWTASKVAMNAGLLDRALETAIQQTKLNQSIQGAERDAALAMGQIADVLWAGGKYEEALRIYQENVLPAFESEPRERAIVLGQIADVLQALEQYDEALRIRREEELPIYERLENEVREKAVTLEKIANLLGKLGKYDEALRIHQEDVLPVFEQLSEARTLPICRANIGINYLARDAAGDREKALELLNLALQDAQRLQLPEAGQIAEIIRQAELN